VKTSSRLVVVAGILIGLGVGGLFDGIVLHQILQWHHLICRDDTCTPLTVEQFERQTLADGLFHAGCWMFLVTGVVRLATARPLPEPIGRPLLGAAVLGWGVFNVVEGVVNHHLLGIHHVRMGPNKLLWDLAFDAWGLAMIAGGWWTIRRVYRPDPTDQPGV